MQNIMVYHNPRCSKSRRVLELLAEHQVSHDLRLYLDEPLNDVEIKQLLQLLDVSPRDLIRKSEPEYKDNGLDYDALSDEQLIEALVDFPILLQRPIIICGNKACIGRPPENVLALIGVNSA